MAKNEKKPTAIKRNYYELDQERIDDDTFLILGGDVRVHRNGQVYKWNIYRERYEFSPWRDYQGKHWCFHYSRNGKRNTFLVAKVVRQLFGGVKEKYLHYLDGNRDNMALDNLGSRMNGVHYRRKAKVYPKEYRGYHRIPGLNSVMINRDGEVYSYFHKRPMAYYQLGNIRKYSYNDYERRIVRSLYPAAMQYAIKYRVDYFDVDMAIIQYKDGDITNTTYDNIYSSYFSYDLEVEWKNENTAIVLGCLRINRRGNWWRLSRGKWVRGERLVRGYAIALKNNKQVHYKKLMKELFNKQINK